MYTKLRHDMSFLTIANLSNMTMISFSLLILSNRFPNIKRYDGICFTGVSVVPHQVRS